MKIKIGVPYAKHGRITETTLASLTDIAGCDDLEVEIVTQQGSNVPRARNAMINGEKSNLIHQELSGFDFFLCVDADTGFTVDNVKQLVAHDLDIVSGAYAHKHDSSRMVAGWFSGVEGLSSMKDRVTPDKTGVFEVDWAGAGFMLIKRETLERMPYPWFSPVEVKYQSEQGTCAQVTSDDFGFCMKARRHGEKIMLDADCRVDHVPHPNEYKADSPLTNALNDLLTNRDTIIRHIKIMNNENMQLRQMLQDQADKGK